MKLHELSPAIGSTKEAKRIGRGHGSGNGKTAGKVTRDKRRVPVVACNPVLKADRCPFRDVFLSVASITFLL